MTITEVEEFYNQDQRKYEVVHNRELLNWLKKKIKNGYDSFVEIECLQELIDSIVSWYEIKYPEREMEFYEGITHTDFEKMETLSKVMDIKQLMYRLPHKQLRLMKCNYCSPIKISKRNFKDSCSGNNIPYILLKIDVVSGEVYDDEGLIYNPNESVSLDELLILLREKYSDWDLKKLEKCIYNHNCDIELRQKILQLVALKLLYSRKTTPERGYERAKRFINEFNKKMNLNLSTEEIDKIFNKDYSKKEKWIKTKKAL